MREVPGSIPGAAHVLSFSFVVRASRAGAEAGLEREDAQEQPRGKRGVLPGQNIFNVTSTTKTLCPSGLRGWTQVPLARAAWAQIPQVSYLVGLQPTQADSNGLASPSVNHWTKVSVLQVQLNVCKYPQCQLYQSAAWSSGATPHLINTRTPRPTNRGIPPLAQR